MFRRKKLCKNVGVVSSINLGSVLIFASCVIHLSLVCPRTDGYYTGRQIKKKHRPKLDFLFYINISRTSAVSSTNFGSILIFAYLRGCLLLPPAYRLADLLFSCASHFLLIVSVYTFPVLYTNECRLKISYDTVVLVIKASLPRHFVTCG